MKQFLLVACVLVAASVLFGSEKQAEAFRKAPPEVEEAVRARVRLFYELFKEGKFRQAEELVAEESKDVFYNTQKKALLGFELSSITFDDEFKEANVLVNVDTMFPLMGATPFKVPISGTWRWINDNWFLYMAPHGSKGPFGEMKGQKASPGEAALVQGAFAGAGEGVKPESFSRMYATNRSQVKFPSSNDSQPVERTVTFANIGPARLTLKLEGAEIPGLVVDVGEGPLEPGDHRQIIFRYHPEIAQLEGERKIMFGVLPIMRKFGIKATFQEPPGARSAGPANTSEPAAAADTPASVQPAPK
ncbi:MAG: hypothetical protein O2968_04415 [Acidobacteria bacterium]|nr:hypothetical protein [Acidobacteriota bacterium]